jgi:NADH:ubiquinone oxidoreductase subunit H
MVSYEVSIGFIMITIVICCGSFNLQQIIEEENASLTSEIFLEKLRIEVLKPTPTYTQQH